VASITITIPDPVLNRVLDAIAAVNGYNAATDGTKAAFAKAHVIKHIKEQVALSETLAARATADATVAASVSTDIALS
jgi:hypothetical protein